MRKMIYVPSQEVWDSVLLEAKRRNRSASNYLLSLHLGVKGDGLSSDGPKVEVSVVEAPPPLSSDKKASKISELKGQLSEVTETPRQRMKRMHPNDMCMGCKELNKNCRCK